MIDEGAHLSHHTCHKVESRVVRVGGGAGYIKGGRAGARDEHEAELCREQDERGTVTGSSTGSSITTDHRSDQARAPAHQCRCWLFNPGLPD